VFTPEQEAYLVQLADKGLAQETYLLKLKELDLAREKAEQAVAPEVKEAAVDKEGIRVLQETIAADPEVTRLTIELSSMRTD